LGVTQQEVLFALNKRNDLDRAWKFLIGKNADTQWGSYSFRLFSGQSGDLVFGLGGGRLRIGAGFPDTADSTTNFTDRFIIQNNGNVGINTTTDGGYKLHVNGTARVSGTLTVNSNIIIPSGIGFGVFANFFNHNSTPFQFGTNAIFASNNTSAAAATGTKSSYIDGITWAQSSGTADFASFRVSTTINQTGTATGITRGLYINPTLTAAADFRAIETTAGNVLFGASGTGFFWDDTNNRLGIGTASPAYRLDVTGNSRFLNDLIVGNTTAAPNLQLGPPSSANYGATLKLLGYNSAFKNWELSVGLRGQNFNISPSTTDGGTTFSAAAFCISTNSNVLINTTTDAGLRLDVNGTARVSSFALMNSIYVGATPTISSGSIRGFGATNALVVGGNLASNIGFGLRIASTGGTRTTTSGESGIMNLVEIFNPTSGTGTFAALEIGSLFTINQTGGANGITRGLYINPTLTAAADFRAIHTTRGKIIFENLPTSATGLPTGAIWNDSGTLKIV
jgi:hypothetical protein